MGKLPFKLSAQTVGAQKAHRAMVEQYGKEKGEEIYLKKADEQGMGNTLRQKVNSIYKTGAKIGRDNSTQR